MAWRTCSSAVSIKASLWFDGFSEIAFVTCFSNQVQTDSEAAALGPRPDSENNHYGEKGLSSAAVRKKGLRAAPYGGHSQRLQRGEHALYL